jgi:glycosyltransferase involved in cell wall biosynthesis
MTKIAIVDLMFTWPPHGGACVDVKETASRLQEKGFEIHLFTPVLKRGFERGKIKEEDLPFEVHKIKFSLGSFNFFFVPKRFKKEVDKISPDYVFLTDSYFLKPYLIRAFKKYKIVARFFTYELICLKFYELFRNGKKCEFNYLETPIVCLSCGLEAMGRSIKGIPTKVPSDPWVHEFLVSLAFLPGYHNFAKKSLSLCDTIIVYNNLMKELLEPYTNNIQIIPGGVDPTRFDYAAPKPKKDGKKYILMVGRAYDYRKGFPTLLKAIELLKKKRTDFEVFVTTEEKINEEHFVSLGWLDHMGLQHAYQKADICVVPSLWEEPFGMVALEAMACGRPVIASRVGGLAGIVRNGETGYLFPPGDEYELAEKLDLLCDSDRLRERMGLAGRKLVVEEYSWDKIVFSRYYNSIFRDGDRNGKKK